MAEGAHLIIINSDEEAQVLKEVYALNPANTIFAKQPYASIGTYLNPGDAGYWMTVHGKIVYDYQFLVPRLVKWCSFKYGGTPLI